MKRAALALLLFGFGMLVPSAAPAAVMLEVPATPGTEAIPIYVARPDGNGPFPTVLLLHGCGGFDGRLAVAADLLAQHGMVGVALDSLGPHGFNGACGPDDNGEPGESSAARAVLTWLRTQPYVAANRLALLGFSMGADAALDLIEGHATPPGLRAAVAYYPACERRDGLADVPVAIFDGSADQITPAVPCAAMVKAGTAAGKTLTITTYPNATHGFDVPGPDRILFGQPMHFDPDATRDAAFQTFRFLVRYLGP